MLRSVADHLDYLVAFNRGERISASLAEIWRRHSSYRGARVALDGALAQEQLLSSGEAIGGIHVMNMHKAKGKQFDGVVLFRAQHSSPFVWRDDPPPYARSRKLLHVAISRARVHVLVLEEAFPDCGILGNHVL
jgi:DNA helicase-2/ATP-dependent DNA helicase PcrA